MASMIAVALLVVIVALAGSAVYLAFSQSGGGVNTGTVISSNTSTSSSSTSSSTTSSISSSASASTSSSSPSSSRTSTASSASASKSSSVSLNSTEVLVIIPPGIQDLANKVSFEPINITVVIGVNNTIVWLNNDNEEHILESTSWPQSAQPFQFYSLPGETNAVTFTTPGKYTYFCEWHPIWMDGTINVIA